MPGELGGRAAFSRIVGAGFDSLTRRSYIGDKLIRLTDGPGYLEVWEAEVIEQSEYFVVLQAKPTRWNKDPQPVSYSIESLRECLREARTLNAEQWKWVPRTRIEGDDAAD